MADTSTARPVALVTGASSGMGKETAKRFLEEGLVVYVAARRLAQMEDLKALGAIPLQMDISVDADIVAAVHTIEAAHGGIDVLVNNAGFGEPALLCDTTLESWNRTLAVTLTSVFLGLKHALPVMRRQGRGTVVNTASVSGIAGDIGMPAYNAAKAGVVNLTRAAALECAGQGIRVNCVCPGGIDTRVTQILAGDRADELRRTMAAVHPLQRMGSAEEVAAAIAFLACDEASFITGAALLADGGLTAASGLPPYVAR